jgi:hypothetical protein
MAMDASSAVVAPTVVADTAPITGRPKKTFMLHDPADMSAAGRFVAPGYREAALKAASRGHTDILLRKSGTREIRQFQGFIETLSVPKTVKRGDREVLFSKKPNVKFVKKYQFDGKVQDDETN